MDLKIPKFDELKDKLGFKDGAAASPRRSSSSRRDDYGRHADYDDFGYEDFGEYAYDDSADYASSRSEDYAFEPSFDASTPRLVTADDVRAHTQYTPNIDEDAPAPSRAPREAPSLSAMQPDEQRSPGLNSLFTSTNAARNTDSATGAYSHASQTSVPSAVSAHSQDTQSFSPVASSEPRVVQRSARILTVLKPEKYEEAERIAKILKAGDVAVLSLRNTPEALGKRILDFSFGVACALDARVEFVGEHVFALSRGVGLSDSERTRLRDQGLM